MTLRPNLCALPSVRSWGRAARFAFYDRPRAACLIASAVVACETDFPLVATDCDDWCLATLRADCSDDLPHDCVGSCEQRAPGRRYTQCNEAWLELRDCYADAAVDDFTCINNNSHPENICVPERLRQAECVSASVRVCVERCFYQAEQCEENAADCEQNCFDRAEVCPAEAQAVDECALQVPVSCMQDEQPPPLDSESITGNEPPVSESEPTGVPCLQELGVLLECAQAYEREN